MPRFIAFYLPQYHPIPENDRWWGKDFTEWTNVVKGIPLFEGHYQPHVPADLGYYDLCDPVVRERQAELARAYGVYGFCYYYYWFNGKRLLETPLNEVLRLSQPDFPFCVCWANEPWTRNWDGKHTEILMPQEHTNETDERFILDLLPVLRDERYIRINGRPLVLIYRTELLPDIRRTALVWREVASKNNIDLYLCRVESFAREDLASINFDASCEFPPNISGILPGDTSKMSFGPDAFEGNLYDYRKLVELMLHRPDAPYRRFRGVTPSWDNTARMRSRASVFLNSSPDLFRHWLTEVTRRTVTTLQGEEQIVFINAWNEWAEGCHLEPDRRYGRAYLEACKAALEATLYVQAHAESAGSRAFEDFQFNSV
jgi:lipopolysaccharide biosynthesis protein